MGPIMWLTVGSGLLMLLGGKKAKQYMVLFETNGAYQTPNGERTELDAEQSDFIKLLAPQLDGKLSWSAPGTLQLVTSSDEFYKNRLVPVNEGQLVVRGVSEVV